jgi:hypothetical protein
MNIVRIYGGLANQLFQYAFGQAQVANGIEVRYELSWFRKEQDPPRPYRLDKFNTNVVTSKFLVQRTIDEHSINYIRNNVFLKLDGFNFVGYWQDPSYYKEILPLMREWFCVKKAFYTSEFLSLRKRILGCNSISLHVRRGDYVSINGHHLLPLEYYQKAMELMSGTIFLFSDDLEWCKKNFKRVVFVDIDDYLAFELMKNCKHHIIANSTFSWMAAYLDDKPDKKVITPYQWRISQKAQEPLTQEFLIPDGWTQIKLPWQNYK